ncbi:hypothetical protein [Cytobacillus sp. IB215665]|uniref:hypothetical protein n=1 Tax=Cytobacillus sp. IB215665 TaxID=3097357 RepID=UPI002A11BA00|nr:hypothetical protein [Cytobacillus sp. IB215665]MDX8366057.1 hypothetical protein [Cytobacillus sp. IB215665]
MRKRIIFTFLVLLSLLIVIHPVRMASGLDIQPLRVGFQLPFIEELLISPQKKRNNKKVTLN